MGIKKLLNIRLKFFHALLISFIIFFLIPIIILISQSLIKLENIKNLSNETTETIVKEQTAQLCQSNAENIAKRISDFLISCEKDLESLSQLPPKPNTYLKFSNLHQRYVNSLKGPLPIYKEISLINKDGTEIIKIFDNKIVPIEQHRNVNIPVNTTYKSEKYFQETKIYTGNIYVSHLNGWYISRMEQLEQGKSYSGVFRFCKKRMDLQGNFAGIYMIALDHQHLMDFIWHQPLNTGTLLTNYKTGNYNYIIDDDGWIIAHPKLWDIKGFDRNGNLIEPLTENTPKWKIEAGYIPINLFELDWRHRDIYTDEPMSSIVKRVQRGETAIYTMPSSGIYGEAEGIIRTRACAPIKYNSGPFNKFDIFGGVVVGTSTENLLNRTKSFTAQVVDISKDTKKYLIFLAVILSIAVISFSFLLARFIAETMLRWNNSLIKIGQGEFIDPEIKSPIKEITEVSAGFNRLSEELKEKDKKIKKYIKDLEIINVKFRDAQKEIDSYWKHEYEIESASVLGEKLASYEREYPKLKKIRETHCIGDSPQFRRVLRQIIPLSQMTIPAWIYGESGVGKTALARVMYSLSPRSNKPFQAFEAIEFSAADPLIVMGKLFGYGPGHGLRGIHKNGQKGILEECDGGTLLIDDVDALPLETQAQLLRVVDGLHFHPAAGKTRNINSNIRFIFASNVDLEQRVRERLFRKDLFRRMGGSINKIEIPPLRDRKSDILLLINFFISDYNKKHNTELLLDNNILNYLRIHDYSEGNIGELKMMVELACENVRIEGEKIITMEHIQYINFNRSKPNSETVISSNTFNEKESKKLAVLRRNHFQMEISEEELKYKRGSRTLSHHLRGMCLKALFHNDWNVEEAGRTISDANISSKVFDIIQLRMKGYIKNISEKGMTSQEHSLFKNLPTEYHPLLRKAIDQFKNNST